MLRTGWTRSELERADPEDIARMVFLIDAERLAGTMSTMEAALNRPIPSGKAGAALLLDQARIRDAYNILDAYLEGGDDDG